MTVSSSEVSNNNDNKMAASSAGSTLECDVELCLNDCFLSSEDG